MALIRPEDADEIGRMQTEGFSRKCMLRESQSDSLRVVCDRSGAS